MKLVHNKPDAATKCVTCFRLQAGPQHCNQMYICVQVSIYRSLLDITAGMDYLHSAGVMHGDLKGANVLLKSTATDPRGFQCKLADFGLSRMLDLDMTHISTHTYGTISYMPPELLSQGKMTRAADVYSFGMLSKQSTLYCGNLLAWTVLASAIIHACAQQYVAHLQHHMPSHRQQSLLIISSLACGTDV